MSLETPVASARVALVGNPNSGKSTVFNSLTGARQQVGNYPGMTVERRQGKVLWDGGEMTLVDLPGTYSLAAASRDEQIVVDMLAGRIAGTPRPDVVVCVVDATNLRRNLFLVSQVAETGLPLVIALNMIDEAEARGVRIDVRRLEGRLGVPILPTDALHGRGLDELRAAIPRALRNPGRFAPVSWPPLVREALKGLETSAQAAGLTPNEADLQRLLFDEEPSDSLAVPLQARKDARSRLKEGGVDPAGAEAQLRYRHLDDLLRGVVTGPDPRLGARSYAADRFLTHRFWGLVTFAALMFLVFSSIYWLARPIMDGIEWIFSSLGSWAGGRLAGRPMLRSLVADGILPGVGGVVVFLPQILILFFFVAVLEATGYMARAAFLMDKVFSWTGLNGKSFVPMLSSYACAIPGILATRTIEDPKARLSTILVAPLMSCSARLPVYVLMIGAFIEPRFGAIGAGAALFAMHILGLVVAIPIAFLINRYLLKFRSLPFLLEMPPYRPPHWRSVFLRMYLSGREFVMRAGTVIFAFAIVIWALTYFPRPAEVLEKSAYLEQSYLGRFGKAVQPVFAPAGFDWKTTVAILAAFPAREVVVSTLGIIYAVEEGDPSAGLREKMASARWPDGRPVYTPIVAVALMVFFAFCMQCGSTVAVIAREAGWRWAFAAFGYMTALAWVGAVVVFQGGKLLTGRLG